MNRSIDLREFWLVVDEHAKRHGRSPTYPYLAKRFGVTVVDIMHFVADNNIKWSDSHMPHTSPLFRESQLTGDSRGRSENCDKGIVGIVTPHKGWWELISGYEAPFKTVTSLYHAVSNPNAKVTEISITSSGNVRVFVEQREKWASFDVVRNDEEARYLELSIQIINAVGRKDIFMAGVLEELLLNYLRR